MYIKKGAKYEQQGNWEKAITYYEKAALKSPKDPEVQEAYGQAKSRYAKKITEDAIQYYKANKKTVGLLIKCIAEAERAAKISDRYKESQSYLAEWGIEKQAMLQKLDQLVRERNIYLKKQEWDKSIELMQKANALYPEDNQYARSIDNIKHKAYTHYLNKGKTLFSNEKYDQAHKALKMAIKYEKSPEATAFIKRTIYAIEAEKKYPSAKALVNEQKYYEALPLLAEILELNPDKKDAVRDFAICHYYIGIDHESSGRLSLAIRHFTKAVEYNPQDSQAQQHLKKNRKIFHQVCTRQIEQFQHNDLYGNAYLLLKVLSDHQFDNINQDPISNISNKIEKKIRQRTVPVIAVLDFQKKMYKSSPLDLSRFIPDTVYERLANKYKQIEFVDRGSAMDKLREAGVYLGRRINDEKISSTAKLLNATFVVYGEITGFDYHHDRQTRQHSERYRSGYHSERNPDYDRYLESVRKYEECERNRKPGSFTVCLPPFWEPNQTVEVADYSDCYYTKEIHTLNANVRVRYKIYDNIAQKVVFDQDIHSQDTYTDSKVQGCEVAGVRYDPLELPSQEEFTNKLVNKNAVTFSRSFRKILRTLSNSYYMRGVKHEKAVNKSAAVEDYMAAYLLNMRNPESKAKFAILADRTGTDINPNYSIPLATHTLAKTPIVTSKELPAFGQRFAVIIGIDKYQSAKIPKLGYAQNDALLMHQTLISSACGFSDANVELLLGSNATMRNMKSAIGTRLARKVSSDDLVFIFFAGHGAPESDMTGKSPDGYTKYLLPWDADSEDLYSTAIPFSDIAHFFERIEAKNIIFVTDACYSGASGGRSFLKDNKRAIRIVADYMEKVTTGSGHVIITASDANEPSLEIPSMNHGLFTKYFVEGLRGKADINGDNLVMLDELYNYVAKNVSYQARKTGNMQHPVMKGIVKGSIILSRVQ